MKAESTTKRNINLDYLRVAATLGVIVLHVSSQNFYSTDVNGSQWQVFNVFDSIVRWSVPVFVMISGSLFLGREIPLRKLYSKYILRLTVAFITWSLLYAILNGGSVGHILLSTIKGNSHMWFILMIIGLYISVPVLKLIVDKGWKTKYYLTLSFVFAFFIPEVVNITRDFGSGAFVKGINSINDDLMILDVKVFLGYSSYFILGYCINKIEIERFQRRIIYLLGLLGFIFTIVVDAIVAIQTQQGCSTYYGFFNVNVLLESISVFVYFKYLHVDNQMMNLVMRYLAKYSFGVYLVHILILNQLNIRLGLNSLSFSPILSVLFFIVSAFSYSVSAILNQLPVVRDYLV